DEMSIFRNCQYISPEFSASLPKSRCERLCPGGELEDAAGGSRSQLWDPGNRDCSGCWVEALIPRKSWDIPNLIRGSLGINPKKSLGSKLGLIWDFDA